MKPCKVCGKKDGKCKTCSESNKALVEVIKLLSKKKKKGKKKGKGASLKEYVKNKMLLDLQAKLTGSGGGSDYRVKTANLDTETIKKELLELKEAQKAVTKVKPVAAPLALSYEPEEIDYRTLPWTSPPPKKDRAIIEEIDDEVQRLEKRRTILVKHMREAESDRNPILQKENQEKITEIDKKVKQLNTQKIVYNTRRRESEKKRVDALLEKTLLERQRLDQEDQKHEEKKELKKQLKKDFDALNAKPRDERHAHFNTARLNEAAVLRAKQAIFDDDDEDEDASASPAAAAAAAAMSSPVAVPAEPPRSTTARRSRSADVVPDMPVARPKGRPKSQRTLFEEAVAKQNSEQEADVRRKF